MCPTVPSSSSPSTLDRSTSSAAADEEDAAPNRETEEGKATGAHVVVDAGREQDVPFTSPSPRRRTITEMRRMMIEAYESWVRQPVTQHQVVQFFESLSDKNLFRRVALEGINSSARRFILSMLLDDDSVNDRSTFPSGQLTSRIISALRHLYSQTETVTQPITQPPNTLELTAYIQSDTAASNSESDHGVDDELLEAKYDSDTNCHVGDTTETNEGETGGSNPDPITQPSTQQTSIMNGKDEVKETAVSSTSSQSAHINYHMTTPSRLHHTRSITCSPQERADRLYAERVQRQLQFESESESESRVEGEGQSNSNSRSNIHIKNIINKRPTVEELANHGKLLRYVPYSIRSKFQRECGKYFSRYTAASHNDDQAAMVDAICKLLAVPSYMLLKMNGEKKHRATQISKRNQIMYAVMTDKINGHEAAEQMRQAFEIRSDADSSDVEVDGRAEDDIEPTAIDSQDINTIRTSIGLLRSQHVGRAARTLMRPKACEAAGRDTSRLIDELITLHPQAKADTSECIMPDNPRNIIIDLKDATEDQQFRALIQKAANGSAPGLSGWTGDMLKVIYPDRDCRVGLAKLICDISNGDLPEEAKEYLLPSHLIALPKPTQSIRPISMGEIFYRVAALKAVTTVSEVAAKILSPIQFGVGIPAGCEQAVHRLQHQLTRSHPFKLAGIAVDFKNAFNQRNRNDILKELYRYPELKPIWKIVDWAYSNPSALWIRDDEYEMVQPDELQSSEGVKQGDPLGALLFALSMKPIYDHAVECDPTDTTTAVAYLDDCTLVGLPDMNLIRSFIQLKEKARAGGLEVNMDKTKFLWLHSDGTQLPETVIDALHELNLKIEYGAVKILGAPIGTDVKKMQRIATETVKGHERFFNLIRSKHMPLQEALLLLRMCGAPRFNYLARTTHSSVLLPAAAEFDRLVFGTLMEKFELPSLMSRSTSSSSSTTSTIVIAQQQLTLPIRLSGLGLRSAVDSLDFAYLASIVRSVYEDISWWKDNGPTDSNNFSLHLQWQNTIDIVAQKLPGRKNKKLFPQDADIAKFIQQVEIAMREEKQQGKKVSEQPNLIRLQSELCMMAARLKLNELFRLCTSEADIKRLKSLSNPKSDSHVWLSVIPSDNTLIMSGDVMMRSIRYRLGLQPYETMPSQCVCDIHDAFHNRPYHAFSCRTLRSHGTIFRHNLLLQHLATWTRRAGLFTEVEVDQLSNDSRLRPDMVITNGSEMRIIDVTIVDPLNKTNLARAGVRKAHHRRFYRTTNTSSSTDVNMGNSEMGMVATKAAEKEKSKKYAKLISEYGARFQTAAAETSGGLGKEFRELIEFISIVAQEEREGWEMREVVNGLRCAVAVAIQVGNARIITESRNRIAKSCLEHIRRVERVRASASVTVSAA